MLLLPTLAFAHEDAKAKVGLGINLRVGDHIERTLDRIEKGEIRKDNENKNEGRAASTTAANITAKSNRITASANAMLSFVPRVSAAIASTSADTQAALNAKLASFTTEANNAKVQAQAAVTVATGINANNSTTTNASLAVQARTDLKAARDLLNSARKDLFSILRSLWTFKVQASADVH